MNETEKWKERWQRERLAKKEAEKILEEKALELYLVNKKLKQLNSGLEEKIKERTRKLRYNQKLLGTLIQSLNGGILFEDENRKVLLVNNSFYDIFKLDHSIDLIGIDCAKASVALKDQFVNPECFFERIDDLLGRKEIVVGDLIRMTNNKILERDYIPIFLEENYAGHLWHYRDVTEKYEAQEQLRKSEEKYRSIIENMNLGLLEVDNEGIIIKAYDLFCEMVGYTAEELKGANPEELLLVQEYKKVIQRHNQNRLKGISDVYEVQIRKKDGGVIWVLISGAPFYDSEGNIKGSVGIHLDITERKKLNDALVKAKIKAEDAQKAEKEFLAHMSHEIRTPLNAIIGMSHLLFDTMPTPQQKGYLDTLQNAATILHRLISDILDFSKIEAGAIELNREPFNLKTLVSSLHQTFALKVDKKPVDLIMDYDSGLENQVVGDQLLIQRILLNLLGNAIKFTERGSITIKVGLEEAFGSDLLVSFKVIDTGIGIPEDKLDVIFDDFKQASSSTSIKYGGTGLGLAISKQLVDLMEGLIFVESEVGKGTCFTVELPLKDTGIRAVEEQRKETSTKMLKSDFELLIVEDNAMNRAYIGSLLKKWSIPYDIAEDGIIAVEMANTKVYDLIIMDIRMPRMNGYDATIAIRNHSNVNKKTPIVALTASAMESEKHTALSIGMDDFLTKPFAPNQLKKLLNEYMENVFDELKETVEETKYLVSLDHDYLYSFYEDDYESAYEMFDTFFSQIVPEVSKLKQVMAFKRFTEARILVHKIKPTFSMVGLTWVTEKFARIEQCLDKDEYSIALSIWQAALDEFEKNLPVVEKQLNQLKSLV